MTKRLSVNEIRPDNLEYLRNEAFTRDEEWLNKNRHLFEPGFCPVCGPDADSVPVYKLDNGLVYNKCSNCDTLFLNAHPDKKGYDDFYKNAESPKIMAKFIYPASKNARTNNIYTPRFQRMIEYFNKYSHQCSHESIFIEVGAGSGDYAAYVNNSKCFKKCIVIEPCPELAQKCRENNLTVIEKPVEDVTLEDEFENIGIVGCFEVIEHLLNPDKFLRRVYDILPVGAQLCLTTPNGLGFDILELHNKSSTLGLTHIHLFNPYSLAKLLKSIGFKIIDLITPGILDVDLVEREYKKSEISSHHSWLANFILNADTQQKDNLQKFLLDNKQSSHMWVIAEKV